MNMERVRWIAVFVAAGLVGVSVFWLPAPLPIDAPANHFSAARAFEHVKAIAKAPHPVGSAENQRVREYVLTTMRELGLNPREIRGEKDGVKVVNLYGELPGAQNAGTNPPILLVAHYDSVPGGPGAADDTTGVATLLETIRALKSRGPLPLTLGVLFTDGEESHGGLPGSETFVRDHPDFIRNLRLVINCEARGNRGPVVMFQTGPNNNGPIELFARACPLPVTASFSEEVYRRMPNDTDFTPFMLAGKRGFNFGFIGGIEYYHSANDTPANLSQRTLQHYGACVLPLVESLAQSNLETLDHALRPGDATFFPLLRGLLVHYPAAIARAIAYVAAALFLFAIVLGFRRSTIRVRQFLAGLAITILTTITAATLSWAFLKAMQSYYKPRSFGPFVIGLPHETLLLAITIFLSATLTFLAKSFLLRRANNSESLAAALVPWLGLALLANQFLPGASYLFTWPTLFATGALFLGDTRSLARTLLTAAPSALLLAPTVHLMHQAITIGLLPLFAALTALAFSLAPPKHKEAE